jgi:hypothetical protein
MRKVEWRTEPADETPEAIEVAEFVDSLRDDMSHTWEDFIAEALSMLQFGYSVHEIVYKVRAGQQKFGGDKASSKYADGKIGWARIPIRGQETILKWFFDANGETLGVTQQPWAGPIIDLPLEKCLLFRPTMHKNSPEGRSVLRTAYRDYYFIKRLEEQEAILFERMSGLPVMRIPSAILEQALGTGPQAVLAQQLIAQYKKIVTNVRIDEQMGVILPSDHYPGPNGEGASAAEMYSFKLETPQGGRSNLDANTPIERHEGHILTSVLADFISMGHTTRGAQNLAETKVDLFMNACEGWTNMSAATINLNAIPRVLRFNGIDPLLAPTYVPDMAQRIDLDGLSNYVLRLSQAGMPMFPDPDLQTYLRSVAGMPEEAAGELADPDQDGPGAPGNDEATKRVLESFAAAIAKSGDVRDRYFKGARLGVRKRRAKNAVV